MTLYLTRRYDFSASHRLFNPTFSNEDNWAIFKECNNPNGHGHNYELEVTLRGPRDARTGMLVDICALDELVNARIIKLVDHKHLNFDVPFLEGIIPTAENVVVSFWQQLEADIPAPAKLHRMRLVESKNNYSEYFGEATP